MTLGEAIDQFLEGYKAETTKVAYYNGLMRFFTEATDMARATLEDLKDVTPEVFATSVRRMEREHAPATVAHTVAALRAFWRYLRTLDRAFVDPTKEFRSKKYDNVPTWNVLKEGEAAKMLEEISAPRDRAVFMALVLQGWRASELCKLTWKNVRQEKDGRWVVEWKGKRGKFRIQGLQDAVLEAARAVGGKVAPNEPFIPRANGKPLTRGIVYGIIAKWAKVFGTKLSPHGLRATYISSVISRKGIEAARQLAGHESLSTTQRYSRWQVTSDDPLTVDDL